MNSILRIINVFSGKSSGAVHVVGTLIIIVAMNARGEEEEEKESHGMHGRITTLSYLYNLL